MIKIGTAELKNRLSYFLRKVKEGQKVLVTDRGKPVARLLPVSGDSLSSTNEEILAAMIEEGLVQCSMHKNEFEEFSPLSLEGVSISEMLEEDREQW